MILICHDDTDDVRGDDDDGATDDGDGDDDGVTAASARLGLCSCSFGVGWSGTSRGRMGTADYLIGSSVLVFAGLGLLRLGLACAHLE